MARVSDNMLTMGLRGKLGPQFVFRRINGKTYASRAPRKPDKSKETVAQRNTRSKFREASHWAKCVLVDPEKRKYYLQKAKEWGLTNAYTAAIREYMRNTQAELGRLGKLGNQGNQGNLGNLGNLGEYMGNALLPLDNDYPAVIREYLWDQQESKFRIQDLELEVNTDKVFSLRHLRVF